MRIQDEYTSWSRTYDSDRNLTRDLDQFVTRKTLASSRFENILEIGCGTGKNTTMLAEIGARVWACDLSTGMIEQAKTKIRSANVLFVLADLVASWPVRSDSFDLIVCNLVMEHIEDLTAVFAEAGRVLAPAGKFFVSELHPYRQYQGTQAQFTHADETIKIKAFMHHISDFTNAAATNRLILKEVNEWRHDEDQVQPPRLITFMFEKPAIKSN